MTFDIEQLGGFSDVDSRLPVDSDVRIAVQLLVMQAFAAGQLDGIAKGEKVALKVLAEIHAEIFKSCNTDSVTRINRT